MHTVRDTTPGMHLLLLDTGGTINGILDAAEPPSGHSRVLDWLRQHQERLGLDLESQILMLKDSRAITLADRERLRDAIEESPVNRVLVTHGTYTMPDTGKFLAQQLGASAQARTVVLTGAMIPLGDMDSDAPAALEFAISMLRVQPAGVWIAMSNKVWSPEEVVKDPVSGEYIARS